MNGTSPLTGVGQALGLTVVLDPARADYTTSAGEQSWGGVASTVFWADPVLDLTVVFMTQVLPATALSIRNHLHQLIYRAVLPFRPERRVNGHAVPAAPNRPGGGPGPILHWAGGFQHDKVRRRPPVTLTYCGACPWRLR